MAKTRIGRPYTSRTVQKILKKYITEDMKKEEKRMQIAARLRSAMEAIGMTPKDLAARVGRRPSEIKRLLSGVQDFQADFVLKLESVVGRKLGE